MGYRQIYGINDKSALLREKEIRYEWSAVKESLSSKSLLSEELDGSVSIETELINCITICCKPALFLSTLFDRESRTVNYYVYRDKLLAIEPDNLLADTYIFVPLKSINALVNRVMDDFFGLSDFTASGDRFTAPEISLAKAFADKTAEAVEYLRGDFGADGSDFVESLLDCFNTGSTAFLYFQKPNENIAHEVRFVSRGKTLYIVKPLLENKAYSEIIGADRAAVKQYISSLIGNTREGSA